MSRSLDSQIDSTALTCGVCGVNFLASERLYGRQISCPKCGQAVFVPTPVFGVIPPPPPSSFSSPDEMRPPPPAAVPPPHAPQPLPSAAEPTTGSQLVLMLFFGCIAILSVFVGGMLILVVPNKSRRPPAPIEVAPSPALTNSQAYIEARQHFETSLRTRGPAPQTWTPVQAPPGASVVDYSSGDLELKAVVDTDALSPGNTKPAVLFLHGGFAYGAKDYMMAQPLREAGFITMIPVLRGENGLPGNFSLYYDEVEDVLAAADCLAGLPGTDPEQIFVTGHSAGGTLAILAAMSSDRFAAAASLSGTMDLATPPEHAPFVINHLELRMRSPLQFAECLQCPTRLYFGSSEGYLGHCCRDLARRAEAAGLDVQAHVEPGGHFSAVVPALRDNVRFFERLADFEAASLLTTEVSTDGTPTLGPAVEFEVIEFNGDGQPQRTARRALKDVSWVDPKNIRFNEAGTQLVVGVATDRINTGVAKRRLEESGFDIGSTTFRGGDD